VSNVGFWGLASELGMFIMRYRQPANWKTVVIQPLDLSEIRNLSATWCWPSSEPIRVLTQLLQKDVTIHEGPSSRSTRTLDRRAEKRVYSRR